MMKEVTTIMTVEITNITDKEATNPDELAAWIKETLDVDKVDVKRVKNFVMDKE